MRSSIFSLFFNAEKKKWLWSVYGKSTVWLLFLVIPNVVSSAPILFSLKIEQLRSSETSFLTRATRRHSPEDSILDIHSRKNLNYRICGKFLSYMHVLLHTPCS
jgi:hypothetical protein